MISIGLDHTLFIQIVQFLVIVFIVNALIAKPIRRTMLKREDKINTLMSQTKANLEAIEAKKADYDEKLRTVKAEIAKYQEQLKSDASARTQAMLDKAKAETNAQIEKAREDIQKQADAARQSLGKDAEELTNQIITLVTK